jgi:hypothetical protein
MMYIRSIFFMNFKNRELIGRRLLTLERTESNLYF